MIKKTAFLDIGELGIFVANILCSVVLRVATTLFGETTGSEALIPVVRHKPPPVWRTSLASSFLFRLQDTSGNCNLIHSKIK